MITPIICKNSAKSVIEKIQEYIDSGSIIKGIRVVDESTTQIVLLMDDKPIEEEVAQIWWSGYNAALTG